MQAIGAAAEFVGELRHPVERLLPLDRLSARRLHRRDALGHLLLVVERRRQNVAVRHQHHQLSFDVHGLVVLLEHDLVAGVKLASVEDLVLLEGRDDLLRNEQRQRVDGVFQVEQPASGGQHIESPRPIQYHRQCLLPTTFVASEVLTYT